MKKIGFVEYYISEWHANNYPCWMKEVCEKNGFDFEVSYVWAEEYVSPVDGKNTDEWCKEFGVAKCETIDELCEKSDYIVILAPSNPEKHLEYAKEVLKYKKTTYIDKTFAPNLKEAKEIFDVANEYGTKFFSTSALRYMEGFEEMEGAKSVIVTAGGRTIDEYIVHQIEMAVTLLKEKPLAVKVEKQGSQYISRVKFENDKWATLNYSSNFAYALSADLGDKTVYKAAGSMHFKRLMADILNFFETGETSFDVSETLDVIKIRDGILNGVNNTDKWIAL
ncbi:MAG: hypothetical protein E7411_08440 [Ruminococcaceae bacterium]|nr:hypothetical protein [Oscillospiraceae bacterium]